MKMYFKDGKAKVLIGLGRGKKSHDKRQDIAAREAKRDAERAMAAARRGH
jgi:SsrA-binding protein